MLEAKIAPDQLADPRTALMRGVEFAPGVAESLTFNAGLGSLIQPSPDSDAFRMVVFRAHTKQDGSNDVDPLLLSNSTASAVRPRNRIHGSGLYAGNSPASVGLYSYAKRGREIAAYLTPPMTQADVLDTRTGEGRYRRLGKVLAREMMMHTKQGDQILAKLDASYGDNKVVIVDQSPDTILMQNLQVKDNNYPATPLWYVLRDTNRPLQRIGTAEPIEPRSSYKRIQERVRAKKDLR